VASPRSPTQRHALAGRAPAVWQSTSTQARTLTPSGADTFMELMAGARGESAAVVRMRRAAGSPGGGAPLSPAFKALWRV
jgi:hypothetical protein